MASTLSWPARGYAIDLRLYSDASPLIYLSAIERFHLLDDVFDSVLVPSMVWTEVVEQGEGKPGCRDVRSARDAGWIKVVAPRDRSTDLPSIAMLERGEADALRLALERPNHTVLIDEHAGRSAANQLNLRFTGTIGLLLRAKKTEHIDRIQPDLDRLRREAGFWITDTLYDRVLEAAGE